MSMVIRIKKKNVVIAVTILLLPFILYSCFNFTSVKVGANESSQNLEKIENRWEDNHEIKNIVNNKVLLIGDSRLEYLYLRGESIEIPSNFSFIAGSGMKIDWFINYAMTLLKEELDNKGDNIKYHVVLNMGVNDLNDYNDALIHSENYFTLYEKLADVYPDVKFYALSVNPVDMSIINKNFHDNKRTNYKIEAFNNNMLKDIKDANVKNIEYCDSYNTIRFKTEDGLHYDDITDQSIVNYLVKNCLNYE